YAATTPVHFRGRSGAITTVPASRVLSDPAALPVLHNKLVFVGVTDAATGVDFFTTPAGSQFPGVEMWATAALDILQKSWIREEAAAPDVCNLAWALLMFPGLLTIPGLKKGALLVTVSVMAALSIGAGPLCMRSWLYFWNPVYHIVAWVACIFMVAARKNISFLADDAPLDFSAPGGRDATILPVYRPDDFLQTLPQTQSALFVAEKLGIASGACTQRKEACAVTSIGGKASRDGITGTGAGVVLTKEESARFGALCGGRIVKLLGSGGMADVYLVWNPRLEVYRAVKVMQPGRPEAFRERFETEIRILSKLMHPNIVQFFSVGEWEGLAFIEMEYVQGAALDEVCEQCGLLSPPEAMAVGILTCRALHYAHTQPTTIYGAAYTGVIHRDLKPANIMVSKNGMIKLADFGIARPEQVSLHTIEAGKVVGTLPYLAPEQFDGAQLTARIDLYALGTTLYELVSGERAFPQTEMSSLVKAKALGTVKPLPSHVPKQLAAIINKAMAIKSETRYESARSMGGDLEKALRSFAGAKGYAILQGLAKRFNG
ncbi:MAG TPA: protein kinase, partial [Chitinivibrionales bacterium]